MNYGLKLLEVLRLQRTSFERTIDGKRIFNPALYNKCEDESYRLQKLIGRENKRKIYESTYN
jgi:hypothetical protein